MNNPFRHDDEGDTDPLDLLPAMTLADLLRSNRVRDLDVDRPALTVDDVYADMVGLAEVAEALGVERHRVNRWIERRDSTRCPEPKKILRMGNLYSLVEWKAWFTLWKITRGSETWHRRKLN